MYNKIMIKNNISILVIVLENGENYKYWIEMYDRLRKLDIDVNFLFTGVINSAFEFVSEQNLIMWDRKSISSSIINFSNTISKNFSHLQILTTDNIICLENIINPDFSQYSKNNLLINQNLVQNSFYNNNYYYKAPNSIEDGISFRNEFSFVNTLFPINMIKQISINHSLNDLDAIAEFFGIVIYGAGSNLEYTNLSYVFFSHNYDSKSSLDVKDIELLFNCKNETIKLRNSLPPVIFRNFNLDNINVGLSNIPIAANNIDEMNIVLTSDENLFTYLLFNIYNIQNQSNSNLNFHIVVTNETKNIINSLNSFRKKFPEINISFYNFQSYNFQLYNPSREQEHVSRATYIRLYLADILKIDRVLYLDVDTFVIGDIGRLFRDYAESYGNFARVEREYYSINDRNIVDFVISNLNSINSRKIYKYINAGVIYFDLNNIRKNNLINIMVEHCERNSNKLLLADQDVLNSICVFNDLRPEYNIGSSFWKGVVDYSSKLKIIHFFSDVKPWNSHRKILRDLEREERFSMNKDDYIKNIPNRNAWISRYKDFINKINL